MEKDTRNNEALAAAYQAGDGEALLTLWKKNRGLAYSVARKMSGLADLDDLMQEAFLGMMNAARLYNPDGGSSFSTYCQMHITAKLSRYIENTGHTIRISSLLCARLSAKRRASARFENTLGRKPTDSELAALLELTPQQVEELNRAELVADPHSLDHPITTASGDAVGTLGDNIPMNEDFTEAAEQRIYEEQLREQLRPILEALPEDELAALHLKYWKRIPRPKWSKAQRNAFNRAHTKLNAPGTRAKLAPFCTATYYAGHHVTAAEYRRTGESVQERAIIKAEEALEYLKQNKIQRAWDAFK